MERKESIVSEYIDALNKEAAPGKTGNGVNDQELEQIFSAVRAVKSLKEPALPDSGFAQGLAEKLTTRIQERERSGTVRNASGVLAGQSRPKLSRPKWMIPAAALAACLLILAVMVSSPNMFRNDVAYAMQQAVSNLSSYHGVLEMRSNNQAGEEWLVRRAELWSVGDRYAVRQDDGTVTVNNGDKKWQVRPQEKAVAILPVLPDPTRQGFDLRDEAQRALQYPHEVVGSEVIAGRDTSKLEIRPPGGLAYHLWVDKQTDLPIQIRTPMQNSLQTTYTFISLEVNSPVEDHLFAYQPPQGYKIVQDDPGQLVATVEEAVLISGFAPLLPDAAPKRVLAFQDRMVLDYGDTTITEVSAQGSFAPAPNSALGQAAGGPLEVWWEGLRWRQNGLEIKVTGPQRVALAAEIAPDLTLPQVSHDLVSQAQVKVSVDMDIVRANQMQVDRGSSPWQLDPLHVAMTFVNLKVSPQGIIGEPEIGSASFKLELNTGAQAAITVSEGPVKKVYLQRLLRQDETGIWSVVGYDPR